MTRTQHERGFTLIEVLATTVLLGLVAAVLLTRRSDPAALDRAAFQAMVRDVRDLDQRARMAARSGSAVALTHDPASNRLLLRDFSAGAVIGERALPDQASCRLLLVRKDGRPEVRYDSTGGSEDFSVVLSLGTQGVRLDVAGLTGWCSEQAGAP